MEIKGILVWVWEFDGTCGASFYFFNRKFWSFELERRKWKKKRNIVMVLDFAGKNKDNSFELCVCFCL